MSMACHAARRLLEMNTNLAGILGIEAMCGAQGIELRAPLETSDSLAGLIGTIRKHCPPLDDDRMVSPDIEALARLVLETATLCDLDGGTTPIGLTP